jgi:saccharopine dehydrogenase-like NADP-dependent oxidoreductase
VSDARKIYSHAIANEHWSAIQITTAAGVCCMVDLFATGQMAKSGFVRQEEISLEQFLGNRFGRHYESKSASRFAFGEQEGA